MDFEWDDAKAESNEEKHGVSFAEALTIFADTLSVTGYDPGHSDAEDRFLTMGNSVHGRLLVVSHTDRGDSVRIISAREASRRERKDYEDGNFPLISKLRTMTFNRNTTFDRCAAWSVVSMRYAIGKDCAWCGWRRTCRRRSRMRRR